MIKSVSVNLQGTYHKEQNLVCQDSFYLLQKENFVIAAVADGLGSEKFSDIGSQIASKTAVEYCAEKFSEDMDFAETKKIMNNSFVTAWKNVLDRAAKDGNPFSEYDTTLCLVIYNGKTLFYGNSGDSSAIVLKEDGHYRAIVKPQNDEEGCVFPLCSGPTVWEFGEIINDVHSVMLMTDGVWHQVVPPVLNGNVDKIDQYTFNIPILEKFMNRQEKSGDDVAKVEEDLTCYLENFPAYALYDDKTVIVLWNPESPALRLAEDYYKPIDWNAVYRKIEDKMSQEERDNDATDDNTVEQNSADNTEDSEKESSANEALVAEDGGESTPMTDVDQTEALDTTKNENTAKQSNDVKKN